MSIKFQKNVSLKNHNSWLVGGPADFFCEPNDVGELREAQEWAQDKKWPITVLSGGTNVLISDKGIRGLTISLCKLSGLEILETSKNLKAWFLAGSAKTELLKFFLKNKSQAACFLAGLPGQVGGGVVMNAGVSENLQPKEFCEIVEAIEVLKPNGDLETLESKKLNWSYRHCTGWQPGIITKVLISYPNTPDDEVIKKVRELNQKRLSKQPLDLPSCGSVFRNPLPEHAGALIEKAGLKGHAIGGAQISSKHANFIVNNGDATAQNIRELMDLAIREVKSKFNVELVSEVVCLGEFSLIALKT